MLKGKRNQDLLDEDKADVKLAKKQAALLKKDIATHAMEILCTSSPAQNAQIAKQFEESYQMSLNRAITNVYSDGFAKAALTALLLKPGEWYAARLKSSFKSDGSSDRAVCRIIGAHDKDEIKDIAAAYDDKYGVRLWKAVDKHCSGDYKRLAIAWIKLPDQLEQPDNLIDLPDDEPAGDEKEDLDEAYQYVNDNLPPSMPAAAKQEFETPYTPPALPPSQPGTPPPPQPQIYAPTQPVVAPPTMMNGFGQMGHQQMMMTTMMSHQQTIYSGGQQTGGMRKMVAVVPFNMYGGMQMTVKTNQFPPNYGKVAVTIPPGYGPGSKFVFQVPA